mmetsp:Transcript_143/g.428  ORF Transcript_143/g.428 Transcript_143/m.428 type:complete len:303 (-) Transcript_143:995-1903(-)
MQSAPLPLTTPVFLVRPGRVSTPAVIYSSIPCWQWRLSRSFRRTPTAPSSRCTTIDRPTEPSTVTTPWPDTPTRSPTRPTRPLHTSRSLASFLPTTLPLGPAFGTTKPPCSSSLSSRLPSLSCLSTVCSVGLLLAPPSRLLAKPCSACSGCLRCAPSPSTSCVPSTTAGLLSLATSVSLRSRPRLQHSRGHALPSPSPQSPCPSASKCRGSWCCRRSALLPCRRTDHCLAPSPGVPLSPSPCRRSWVPRTSRQMPPSTFVEPLTSRATLSTCGVSTGRCCQRMSFTRPPSTVASWLPTLGHC